ncbi:PREDICTED: lipase 3-like [Ceratosolen solmsi marchali]|uniref:Lipase 3-like n=1 Tax=Ceratosolen solmsi marchali TaxID=326594 RepID=A0AAJ6YHW8_9HYME|nr:PREDICTED: lipase 3-like [Ceratosolen solmsi marchali]XP_011498383.1 PREDICTED: lipase 3-like [Ceratosolen solmsi marchali]
MRLLSRVLAEGLVLLACLINAARSVEEPVFGLRSRAFVARSTRHLILWQMQGAAKRQRANVETFVDLVRATGYQAEEHDISTEDGYILKLHRMPGSPKSPVGPKKPVVLFIHGLLAASDIWVLRGPDEDLAYLLVDAGYDVWLMNMRGNFYARRHKNLKPKEEKFWRFSWHESGLFDTASSIDYILNVAGQKKLSIIGHSMGSTISLVLLSMKPEYNEKINGMLFFAPISIFTHVLPGPLSTIAVRYGKQLQKTLKTLGVNEIMPRNSNLIGIYTTFCQAPHIELLCQKLMFNMAGLLRSSRFDAFDEAMFYKMMHHYPQGSSVDTILHYRQIMISGKFRQYDFGPDVNYIYYKNVTPPEYPLERITVPTVLYYGMNDAYTTKEDVEALMAKLPNAEIREIQHERFSHLDFIFSNFAKSVLYEDSIRMLDQFRNDDDPSEQTLEQAIEHAKLAPSTVTV